MPFVDQIGRGEKIGSGHESDVYAHNHKDVVYKQRFEDEQVHEWDSSPNYIKAEFYLTKLSRLLFPKNIPDIMAAGRFSQIQERVYSSPGEVDPDTVRVLRANIEEALGIKLDRNIKNFVKKDDDMVYLDRISPWYVKSMDDDNGTKEIWYRFSKDKVTNLISNINDKKQKEIAKHFWDSVLTFLSAEEKRLNISSRETPINFRNSSSDTSPTK